MSKNDRLEESKALFALALVETCFRYTRIEDIHAGRGPVTATGDFSDVVIRDAEGEIPWNEASRISDDEMRGLMIEAVNRVYTFMSDPTDLLVLYAAGRWNRPEHDGALQRTAQRRAAVRNGLSQEEAFARFPLWPDTSPQTPLPATTSALEVRPDDLRQLGLAANVDAAWVRQAREALLAAADQLQSAE
ncbi:hypothetical protein [Caulobacter sp. UC70_42]|uniref:hypothetical protein n=1 Tax=Caulobacter sp. UC70_42 TaxID=3374551 RepID=UPI003757DBFA